MRQEFANQLYHCGRYRESVRICSSGNLTPDLAVTKIKSLCEMDQSYEAAAFGEEAIAQFPDEGIIDYFTGFAYYLSQRDADQVLQMFQASVDKGCSAGYLGLGFIDYLNRDFKAALLRLDRFNMTDIDMRHIHLLVQFQVLLTYGKIQQASKCLDQAYELILNQPSFTRTMWNQICRIRLLRTEGKFEEAKVLNEEILRVSSAKSSPRVTRNAEESLTYINRKQREVKINLPSHLAGFPEEQTRQIRKKPMLNSLLRYLYQCGPNGAPKEDIVNSVWSENYNPLVHDERLYKAIGRLRKLLNDDCRSPKIVSLIGRNYVLSVTSDMQAVQNQ